MPTVKILLLAVALLSGCSSHTAWQASAGGPPAGGAQVQVSAGSGFFALFGLALLASGGAYQADWERVPEMAPGRKIHEVDCSKPFDSALGNIRCR